MKKKHLLAVVFTLLYHFCHSQTVLEIIRRSHDCDDELRIMNEKITDLNHDYKSTLEDLKNGLYCSKCSRSKTNIEKSGEGFYQHVKRVQGDVQQAPQELFDKTKKEYENNYRNLSDKFRAKQKQCDVLKDEMNKTYRASLLENAQKQQVANENRYAELLRKTNEQKAIAQETSNRFVESVSSLLSKIKGVADRKVTTIATKNERFWNENKAEIKELGMDFFLDNVEEKTGELTGEVKETVQSGFNVDPTNSQIISSAKTIYNIPTAGIQTLEKNIPLAMQDDAATGINSFEEAEKNQRDFEKTQITELMKAPVVFRKAFDFFESQQGHMQEWKRKAMVIRKVGSSAIRIYFFNE